MSELKPCPFCGGEAKYGIYFTSPGVKCTKCTAGVYCHPNYESAISAWNRRAQPAEPPVRCGECANYQTQNCAAKHEQALMDFCSHGIRKPGGEQE